jgi:hypothetical protein
MTVCLDWRCMSAGGEVACYLNRDVVDFGCRLRSYAYEYIYVTPCPSRFVALRELI